MIMNHIRVIFNVQYMISICMDIDKIHLNSLVKLQDQYYM